MSKRNENISIDKLYLFECLTTGHSYVDWALSLTSHLLGKYWLESYFPLMSITSSSNIKLY